ncbi:heme-binding protein [Sphingomonas sp. S1-29]|uniref:SOUL family heme-binding protein n=1 Tax=Sphingomonas sp. S1-29 TaxID=2991074 RepID=UPI00223F0D20|nr:heme-binding protein [Sphingomonas sp. S1-29]UZK70825.1 heme-binding protein [Sphingomonas sp. S1-29]
MMEQRTKWIGGAAVAAAAIGGVALLRKRPETPEYTLVQRDGAIEVRDYPALLVATTVQSGLRETALRQGFRTLADYIFAKSRPGKKIAMTAPVLADNGDADGWRTRFVMPSRYDRDSLPTPANDVAIETLPPRRVAAIRFNGSPNDAALAAHESELRVWIDDNGHKGAGMVEHAFYDAPFVPGPLRHNEVLIPIDAG